MGNALHGGDEALLLALLASRERQRAHGAAKRNSIEDATQDMQLISHALKAS